ncbi:MAG: histidine kinase [Lewinellaceae bacterium]|nr:histidine kinase [Lewinellaceae bacterium]
MNKGLEAILHLIFWLACCWILYTAFRFEQVEVVIENGLEREIYTRNPNLLPALAVLLAARALLFYGLAFYVLPRFLERRRRWLFARQLALLAAASFLLPWGLLWGLALPPVVPVGIDTLLLVFFILAAFAYRLSKDWLRHERLRARLVEEKLSAELNYLKAQLNPHFLFNTLNNLYALAEREHHAPLSEGIANLAELMRYAVYDSRADQVPLAKELRFLQNMVEMQSLGLEEEDEVDIAFRVSGEYGRLVIAPLLLVPFVENAFKHGIRYGCQSAIRLEAGVEGNTLYFKAVNTVHGKQHRPHEENNGVGLEIVRRRLQLLYPESHHLETERREHSFSVNLKLELDAWQHDQGRTD